MMGNHQLPNEAIGVIISRGDGSTPNISRYSFILTQEDNLIKKKVRQGQYCVVDSSDGLVIGFIEQLKVDNQYFSNHQTVKNFDMARVNMQSYFPSDQWECHIADVKILGAVITRENFSEIKDPKTFRKIERVGFPVKPGNKVYLLENENLENFLGIKENGLEIGSINYHNLQIKIDLNRLFNKHLAVLAQSGAGKSYLVSVLIEELLKRPIESGTPAILLIDVHGEYDFLRKKLNDPRKNLQKNSPNYETKLLEYNQCQKIQNKIENFNASFLQIGVSDLSEYDFKRYQPGISMAQMRELRKIIKICRKKYYGKNKVLRENKVNKENGKEIIERNEENEKNEEKETREIPNGYDIKDIIFELNEDPNMNNKVRETLIGWLTDLDYLHIFGKHKYPSLKELANVGNLSILNLATLISKRKKQILIDYFTSKLFYGRRNGQIPPFIIFLEEAHNFLPENGGKSAIAKHIFETIAREGRKFFAQLVLISQRPVHLSTTALSQCNTNIIMRVTNPYDLNHIKATSESLTSDSINVINSLPTGNAVILGAALNYPTFLKVRKRIFPNIKEENTLMSVSKTFIEPDQLENLAETENIIQERYFNLNTFKTF